MGMLWPDKTKLFVFLATALAVFSLSLPDGAWSEALGERSWEPLLEGELETPWGELPRTTATALAAGLWYGILSLGFYVFRLGYRLLVWGIVLPWLGIAVAFECPPTVENLPGRLGEAVERFAGYRCEVEGLKDRVLDRGKTLEVDWTRLGLTVGGLMGVSLVSGLLWRRRFRAAARR